MLCRCTYQLASKADLFRALVNEEAQAVSGHIDQETREVTDPEQAMMVGSNAFFEAMLHLVGGVLDGS